MSWNQPTVYSGSGAWGWQLSLGSLPGVVSTARFLSPEIHSSTWSMLTSICKKHYGRCRYKWRSKSCPSFELFTFSIIIFHSNLSQLKSSIFLSAYHPKQTRSSCLYATLEAWKLFRRTVEPLLHWIRSYGPVSDAAGGVRVEPYGTSINPNCCGAWWNSGMSFFKRVWLGGVLSSSRSYRKN